MASPSRPRMSIEDWRNYHFAVTISEKAILGSGRPHHCAGRIDAERCGAHDGCMAVLPGLADCRRPMNIRNARLFRMMALLGVLFIGGCVTPPTKEEIARLDCGPQPANYEPAIKNWFRKDVFANAGVEYGEFSQPESSWVKDWKVNGGELTGGWIVRFTMVAKERDGLHSDTMHYVAFIRNDQVLYAFNEHELEGLRDSNLLLNPGHEAGFQATPSH